jgi:putative pyridoxal-dependent aspartate 1-decarboxylase
MTPCERRSDETEEVLRWLDFFRVSPLQGRDPVRERILSAVQQFLSASQVLPQGVPDGWTSKPPVAALPERALAVEDYVESLLANVIPYCTNMTSRRCMGHMSGAVPQFFHPLSEMLLALNQNLVKQDASSSLTNLERQTIAMLHRLIYGLSEDFYQRHSERPESTLGIWTNGSTISNLTALWIARNRALASSGEGLDVERDGMGAAAPQHRWIPTVVIGSELMHYSVEKSAGLLGIGSHNVMKVAVDAAQRVDIGALRRALKNAVANGRRVAAIVGMAGTTDCGSIDRLRDIADLASEYNVHFHVDAAWGTPLLFSRELRSKLSGIERADSVALDGRKQLHLPAGTNLLLLRNPDAANVIHREATYMLQRDSADLGKRSLEGSRPGNALFMHAAMHVIGPAGYDALITRCIRTARQMAARVRLRSEFELLCEPETNIVVYRYLPPPYRTQRWQARASAAAVIDECNTRLQRAQTVAGRSFVGRTIVPRRATFGPETSVALRAVFVNPLTDEQDCEAVLQEQSEIGEALWSADNRSETPSRQLRPAATAISKTV